LVALDVIIGRKNLYYFFGVADGQRPKHQGVDDSKNGRIRANSENEGEKGDNGEGRILNEHPEGETQIIYHNSYSERRA
jgi:hypothetical protein